MLQTFRVCLAIHARILGRRVLASSGFSTASPPLSQDSARRVSDTGAAGRGRRLLQTCLNTRSPGPAGIQPFLCTATCRAAC
ncbi:uncharacterized protein B0I36DRAFT_315574 [Microdochium trichocladiopsis]|uniref:Uncharacterized protein n=1 Tax=Microdochium trichocladiopsis TaxID=1682393 RepID=A0A9P8YCB0_9PEZI|nr:uncharacterized protein B0I36DRAFT_315574 [Microdochium trichocladiopsis]KAH7038116.1 hypothetical protein B0I36DRAFT_315574 [Microdochium trichocladiopsis]